MHHPRPRRHIVATIVVGASALAACTEDSAAPSPPETRLKTLGELTVDERDELCAWTKHRSSLDSELLHAACTNASILAAQQLDVDCSEQRDACVRIRRRVAELEPCFLDPEAGVQGCDDTRVGAHLDCLEDFRQDTLDVYAGARCSDPASYVPVEDDDTRRASLVERGAGCRELAESCPQFFRSWGVALTPDAP